MARSLGISKTFRQLLRSRYHSQVYGDFRGILDTIIPVQSVGTGFSDIERIAWGIATFQLLHINRYSTSSITSAVDIAIEGIGYEADQPPIFPYANRRPLNGPMVVLTPPGVWVPWANTPAPGAIAWIPGVKPTLRFDNSQTIAITGNVTAPPPFWGLELMANSITYYDTALTAPIHQASQSWHTFHPPMILPAGMFLTVCTPINDSSLWISWRYREIG
ncbi:unnamed protein product [marine sediment metagenome]|uniref:Uncharacterized protein n=1 Tax=marine sediment metagenome TaxID=412755 RepID=X1Q7I7_9ZZZZ